VLILDEPTRGVDVGAKAEIYAIIDELAGQGVAVLVISSELPEVLGLADRIVVMRTGRVVGELARDEATEASVLAMAMPGAESASFGGQRR
jgi:L-arabinose transport system ATP-binding protein